MSTRSRAVRKAEGHRAQSLMAALASVLLPALLGCSEKAGHALDAGADGFASVPDRPSGADAPTSAPSDIADDPRSSTGELSMADIRDGIAAADRAAAGDDRPTDEPSGERDAGRADLGGDAPSEAGRTDASDAAAGGRDVGEGGRDGDTDAGMVGRDARDAVEASPQASADGGDAGREAGIGAGDAGARPAGYFMISDWGVTSTAWAGCVWTQTDSRPGTTSSISPPDFTANHAPAEPYRITGTVFGDMDAFAAIGFNLNEPITGEANLCVHRDAGPRTGNSVANAVPSATRVFAVNWTGTRPKYFGIELLGARGLEDVNDRWCALIPDAEGPSAVLLTKFHKGCWTERINGVPGDAYAGEPLSAAMFVVPGDYTEQVFDVSIRGFALGNFVD